jgi:plastocyanin
MESVLSRPVVSWMARIVGAGLLVVTGAIHLDLYLTGYRHIPTIGPLFVLQVISAFVLALAVLATPWRIAAASGALFALSTLGGYVLSLWFGLFNFNEVRTAAGIVAGAVEIAAFIVLGCYAAFATGREGSAPVTRRLTPGAGTFGVARRAVLPLAAVALVALVVSAASNGPTSASPSGQAAAATGGSGKSVKVLIKNFAFLPAKVTVSPGEKVVITNEDSVAHNVVWTPNTSPVATFNSGDINPGKTGLIVAPSKPGSYHFDCSIHPFMTGVLVVN